VILIKLHENHKNHRKGHVSTNNNKRMTIWRCDSNSEGVCFTEMAREPARQDIKTLGPVIAVPVVKHGSGKKNQILPAGVLFKKSCCGGVKKGNEMKCSYPGYDFSPANGWLYSTYRWPVLYQAEAVSLKWRDGVKYRMNEI
jgi:hypothetical protein